MHTERVDSYLMHMMYVCTLKNAYINNLTKINIRDFLDITKYRTEMNVKKRIEKL